MLRLPSKETRLSWKQNATIFYKSLNALFVPFYQYASITMHFRHMIECWLHTFTSRNLLSLESPSSRTYAPSRNLVPYLSFLSAVKRLTLRDEMDQRRAASTRVRRGIIGRWRRGLVSKEAEAHCKVRRQTRRQQRKARRRRWHCKRTRRRGEGCPARWVVDFFPA